MNEEEKVEESKGLQISGLVRFMSFTGRFWKDLNILRVSCSTTKLIRQLDLNILNG